MKIIRWAFLPPAALLPAILASVMVNGEAQTPSPLETLVLTETYNEITVGAFLQQRIAINLRGNMPTGFGWFLTSANETSMVSNGPSVYIPDSPAIPGLPGTFGFSYLAQVES